MLKFFVRGAIFGLTAFIIVELFFRTALPASEVALTTQETRYKLLMLDTTKQRDGIFTVGRFAHPRAAWHVNNYGWLAHNDYEPPSAQRKPVIAVIGDSYVEGYHVPKGSHVADVIHEKLGGAYDVYRLGGAGAPLSQYLQTARYAKEKFDPAAFVIIVQESDLADAVAKSSRSGIFVQLRYANGQFSELPITLEYRPVAIKRLVRKSAFFRYLALNRRYTFFEDLGIKDIQAALHPGKKKGKRTAPDQDILGITAREIARKLRAEHPDKLILFAVDGDRKPLKNSQPAKSLPEVEFLRAVVADYNELLADMAPVFTAHYRADGQPFHFREDYHWNAHGHRVVGEAIAEILNEHTPIP